MPALKAPITSLDNVPQSLRDVCVERSELTRESEVDATTDIVMTVSDVDNRGQFDAYVDGRHLVTSTQPFLDGRLPHGPHHFVHCG
jgi:hypothetical protein